MPAALNVTDPNDSGEVADAHRKLISRVAQERDRSAFRELFMYFAPRVKAVMIKGGATHDIADDITQDVMATIWRKGHMYAPERGLVSTWVFTIARNARIDRLRRQSSRPYQDIDDIELASGDPDGEDHAVASDRAARVTIAISELPADQKEIIELSFVADMAQSEIARKLSLPLGTVKSRMRLAYKKLKGKLEELQ